MFGAPAAVPPEKRSACALTLSMFVALVLALPFAVQAQPGTVLSYQKISDTEGNLPPGLLENGDFFGVHPTPLGDFDGDGIYDLAVGAGRDDDGGPECGAVYLLYLNSDGTVKEHHKISATEGLFEGELSDDDRFSRVAAIGDLNNDGVRDLAVGAHKDDGDGDCLDCGAVWILFMNANGTVKSHQKISALEGGFTGALDPEDYFGWFVTKLRDLDGDGNPELAVGAPLDDDGPFREDTGAVWILFLDDDGTVKKHQKISATRGAFDGWLDDGDGFGNGIASLGDLDRDGVPDLAVGAYRDDDGGEDTGAVWILFLRRDGKVKAHQKISALEGGFTGNLDPGDWFSFVGELPDIDADGVRDLAVGAIGDDDGPFVNDLGAVWILFLDTDGTVKGHQKISATQGGFGGDLDPVDNFGWTAFLGDPDGDGRADLAVGAVADDDGGGTLDRDRGAVWLLFLDGAVLTAAPEVISSSTLSLANAPNPFRGPTALHYALPSAAAVRLQIFDAQGRQVATLVDGQESAGRHSATWSGRDASGAPVAAGVYYARLEAGGVSAARKIVVLK